MTPSQLKTRLDQLNLSGPKFAEIINRDRRTVLRWLRGESPVPDWLEYRLERIENLSRLLNTPSVLEKESPLEYFTTEPLNPGDIVTMGGKTYKIVDTLEKESSDG